MGVFRQPPPIPQNLPCRGELCSPAITRKRRSQGAPCIDAPGLYETCVLPPARHGKPRPTSTRRAYMKRVFSPRRVWEAAPYIDAPGLYETCVLPPARLGSRALHPTQPSASKLPINCICINKPFTQNAHCAILYQLPYYLDQGQTPGKAKRRNHRPFSRFGEYFKR